MFFCLHSPVQKPEKLSSVCVAAALHDGLRAYTALHTQARIAAGHTLLVMDGASVRKKEKHTACSWRHLKCEMHAPFNCGIFSRMAHVFFSPCFLPVNLSSLAVRASVNNPTSSPSAVLWPDVHPAGLLPRGEGSGYVTFIAGTHFPGAASAQCRSVRAGAVMFVGDFYRFCFSKILKL